MRVPFAGRDVIGIFLEARNSELTTATTLKHVDTLLDSSESLLQPDQLQLLLWLCDYYLIPKGEALQLGLASSERKGRAEWTAERDHIVLTQGAETIDKVPARAKKQKAAAQFIGDRTLSIAHLNREGFSNSVISALVTSGLAERRAPEQPGPSAQSTVTLTEAQQRICSALKTQVTGFKPHLLEGVTGSGKTEVYIECIKEVMSRGLQVLVIIPEIGLTPQTKERFEAALGLEVPLIHSGLSETERGRTWAMARSGLAPVVLGTRSSVFCSFKALGLIVVDEAHETSFKQEDGVRYNARDVAVMRGHFEKVPVILASATPALESLQMAESGIYEKVDLPSRFGGAELPAIELIDLTEEKPPHGMWLAQRLVDGIEERLERGEQSLLFLNRRGYAPLTLCRNCGFRYQCPNCSAWLVEHRFTRRLACHHCGHEAPAPQACTECGEPDCLVACGPGVERIADEVAERLSQARVFVATSDTLNSPGRAAEFIAAVEAREIDVIVGTQLVTKGFHFPELTLVGVVDADLGLEGGDLRAGERTYQQVAQVAGRAGRGSKPGEVLIQTRHPEAPVIAALAAGDRDAFYSAETEMRREAGAPPFGRWASIIISSEDDGEAREAANRLGAFRPDVADCMILGPAPAPMALLRGRYRYRFLINARRSVQLQHVIRRWLTQVDHPAGVRVAVDIDPYSFV